MRCYLCDGKLRPGQRVTTLHVWNRDGSPHAEYSMHERCKDEMLGMNPGLAELIPEIDLDEVG